MKTDYPELAGKKVKITLANEDKDVAGGIVVDANYHVGITIVHDENTDNELMCLNRADFAMRYKRTAFDHMFNTPGTPVGKLKNWKRVYRVIFFMTIAMIRAGHVKNINELVAELFTEYGEEADQSGNMSECAWK